MLGTRGAASSLLAVDAVWTSYTALHTHFSRNSASGSHASEYKGLLRVLESWEFVHSLAVLHDALSELSLLSKFLQRESCTFTEAYDALDDCIEAVRQQKQGKGSKYTEVSQSVCFNGIELGSRGSPLDREAFCCPG